MTLEYATAAGAVLDTLTIDDDGVIESAATGKGREQVETMVRQYRPELARRILRSWSNGYVIIREVDGASVSD